jgi:hypothetical protein
LVSILLGDFYLASGGLDGTPRDQISYGGQPEAAPPLFRKITSQNRVINIYIFSTESPGKITKVHRMKHYRQTFVFLTTT